MQDGLRCPVITLLLFAMLGSCSFGTEPKKISTIQIVKCPRPNLPIVKDLPEKESPRNLSSLLRREKILESLHEECRKSYQLCQDSFLACDEAIEKKSSKKP